MFEGIGKIGQYVQQQNLKYAAKYKLRTGRRLADDMKSAGASFDYSTTRTKRTKQKTMSDDTKISIIKNKLRRGQHLSASEMKYLKENDEDLYDKAKKTQAVRAELQQALKHAKTKQEAQRAVMSAQIKVAAAAIQEARNGGANIGNAMGSSAAASFSNDTSAAIGSTDTSAAISNAAPGAADAAAASPSTAAATASTDSTVAASIQADSAAPASASTLPAADAAPTTGASTAAEAPADANGKQTTSSGQEATDSLAPSADKSTDDTLFDNVHFYELQAIMDEWKKFVHSKDYEEMPMNRLTDDETKVSGKPSYHPKRQVDDAIIASYLTAHNQLLADMSTPGSYVDVDSD